MNVDREEKDQVHIGQVFLNKDMSGRCQSFPHSPRSVPTNSEIISHSELIQGNFLRSETFTSGSHRNISVPVQKLVYSSQERGVGSMLKPLKDEKDKELVEEPKSFTHRPEERVGNDPSLGERRPSGVNQLQKYPRKIEKDLRGSREVSRTIKERKKAKPIGTDLNHKGTRPPNWSLHPWKVYSIWPEPSWNSQPRSRKG
ncbi:hypothetical protein O181_028984 [Austropuccinia psidii MF-1]|uniref:Uncharacterized protein n=1 Tax=Austropuccinia psidii MF-1 TaxID=1389203 RepID=A0A9Q3CQ23_9BASI|nr:hypothetical protein [Austropuccinia psidii MF-1]